MVGGKAIEEAGVLPFLPLLGKRKKPGQPGRRRKGGYFARIEALSFSIWAFSSSREANLISQRIRLEKLT